MHLIPAQLASNIVLILFILAYAIINILAWSKNGILVQEFASLKDTHNERTFSLGEPDFNKIKPFLVIQYYLFFAFSLYVAVVSDPAESLKGLMSFSQDVYLMLAICIAFPLAWYFLQYFFFHWICFIFGGDSRIVILDRIYQATHMLAGPIVMVLFSLVVIGNLSAFWTTILLTGTFILTQLIFIFSGFKVFFNSFSSLCLIIVYLCALEIAPLAVLYVKLGLDK